MSKTFQKPEECPVCLEDIRKEKYPLSCGHWVHKSCIEKQVKNECPLCRSRLGPDRKTEVPDYEYDELLESELYELVVELDEHFGVTRNLPSWRRKGFMHPEEDEDYDEENPHGDSWDYGMC